MLPVWMQIVIGVGAVLGALGIVWTKAVKPAARLITDAEEMLPLLKDLPILREIIAQFRTNSGSSLRDVVDRLEANAEATAKAAEHLAVNVEVARRLAERDRKQLELLVRSAARIEHASAGVASDLEASMQRAHAVNEGQPPGAAADAASRPAEGH